MLKITGITCVIGLLLTAIISGYNCYTSDSGEIAEAGILTNVTLMPTSWNEQVKCKVETSNAIFIIYGKVDGKKNGRCYTKGRFLFVEQIDGNYYKYAMR